VTFIRRATYLVAHDDDLVADINRVQYGCQQTNLSLRSRDDQRIRLALPQMLSQTGFGEGRETCFVDDGRRRAKQLRSIQFLRSVSTHIFTGSFALNPLVQVDDPLRLNAGGATFEAGAHSLP
jgi:hypothetical protein